MPLDFTRAQPEAATVGISDYDRPDPAFMETLSAAYRQENIIGSAFTNARINLAAGDVNSVDPEYNVFEDLKGYEDYADRFENVFSKPAADAKKAQIDQEKRDRETLAASGWTGVGLSMAAGLTDIPTLIPGGAFVRAGKVGYSGLRSAASVGVAAGVGAAAQEAGLQATQELRTPAESALAVGGSVILGGLIGGAGAKFFSKGEWDRVSKQLEADLTDDVPDPVAVTNSIVGRMQAAGAASVEELDLSDLGIGGPKAADLLARATAAARINPGIQTMLSPSVKVREIYGRLVDNPIYTTMNMEGRSLGADVENSVKLYERGAVGTWLGNSRQIYREARNAGYTGSRTEFYQAIARAGRRGDVDPDGNEFVTRAAQEARSLIFDPLLERAKELKLLPDDVKTTTAASYVTRLWNRQRLIGEEVRFRDIARKYFNEELDRALIRQEERKLGNKIVETMYVEDRFNKAFERLSNIEKRLSDRARVRGGKLSRVQAEEARRFDVMQKRAPRPVVVALREGAENDSLVKTVREARSAENVRRAKTPVLSILKKRGGVRLGSPLAGELDAIGVNPKTVPGLFKKDGGRGAADNIVAREYDLFDNLPTDENGYVLQDSIIDAIRAEMAGSPIRSSADEAELADAEALSENARLWLQSIGLRENATIKEIREYLNETLGRENLLDDVDMKIARLNREIEEFDQATDAIKNEQIISDAEARKVAEELRTLEDEINANVDLAKSSPAISRMVDYAKARREYGAARYQQIRVTNRLEALKLVDSEGRLTPELEAEMAKLAKEAKEIEERIAKATGKSDKLKKTLPKQKQDIPDFVSPEDRDDYINEIVDSVFNNLTGRGQGDVPEWIVPVTRGPLKERTFNIPDERVEDFLENDMELVLRRYARTMAAEVELAQKFGRADMKEQFEEITREYSDLRKTAKTDADREKLNAAEARDVKNLTAFRDMIRGTYRAAEEGSDWSKITRAALTWNYVRLMGGVVMTSLTDAVNVLGKFGMRATMTEALPALVSGTKAARIARQDARELGVVAERVLQSRLASLADLQDPYRYGSTFDRFLSNTSNAFTKATGLGLWNDTLRTMVSVMSQNRIMRVALDWDKAPKEERAYLAMLGIDERMAERVATQFRRHGVEEEGIYGANASAWDDDLAYRTWAAALNKDADRIVIIKGVSDNPLWMKTNLGKLLFQFKSFALAAHQRILLAGLQERPHRLAEQLVFATAIGMMISYLKYVERGNLEEAQRLLDNPGLWVANGLDRSGVLAIPFEISNTVEKIGLPGLMTAAQAVAGDEDRGGSASRYASRGKFGALAGPSVGAFEDLAEILRQVADGDIKESGANAVIRQLPGATLPGVRSAIHIGLKPALADAVE
ncbi:hypothetical protein CN090_13140 [Sinorhizobium meliloti]|uniref:hypothetical protein n=1 Tax=Rhizobium meliloti TaxID=382 RepID=UPI000FDA202A|nr:hypothetical protein [Sinorhizobium meliloti]MQW45573.1 hypothetical protein [Sinorhizobium meliloti]RVO50818.1 hypothetical protein CN090_13140 [Sinorhizobium meliloti]